MKGTKNLTQGPILKQLFTLAMPIMATSFIQMAYSLTDMAWVGRIGSEAIAAVGSVGILTWMSTSISLLNKVGSEVSVGQAIGAQNEQATRAFASHNLTLSLLISLSWGALLFIFATPIISIYELEPHIAKMAVEYLRIIATAFPFVFLSAAFTGIFNAAGRSKIPFSINGIGLITNMILDPLSIFVPEKAAYETGGVFLRIDGYSQLFMMLEITIQGVFYGMGRTMPPAVISVTCNYLRIPMALLFVSWGWGLPGIWWSISITSTMKGIICLIWFILIKKKALNYQAV